MCYLSRWILSHVWQHWYLKPRVHLTRFHGVFAPNSKYRSVVTGESQAKQSKSARIEGRREVCEPRKAMNWAMRLKRVFNIDITVCKRCHGAVKIIACIEDRQVIDKDFGAYQSTTKHLNSCYSNPRHSCTANWHILPYKPLKTNHKIRC